MSSFLGDPNTTGDRSGKFHRYGRHRVRAARQRVRNLRRRSRQHRRRRESRRGNVIAAQPRQTSSRSSAATATIIQGNLIGTDADGNARRSATTASASTSRRSNSSIGGIAARRGQRHRSTTDSGVVARHQRHTGTRSGATAIYNATGLGIDLGSGGGRTASRRTIAADADTGANNLQNFPFISSVTPRVEHHRDRAIPTAPPRRCSTSTSISTRPASNFPREFLQGEIYLGSSPVTTDGSGNATFNVTTCRPPPAGARISVTATRSPERQHVRVLAAASVFRRRPLGAAGGRYGHRHHGHGLRRRARP